MFDTLAVLAYLLGHDSNHIDQLRLKVLQPSNPPSISKQVQSPQLQWQNVPPEAESLALIVKDNTRYAWVVYNLPPDLKGLPFDANAQINLNDEGINSWGQKNYHALCWGNKAHPVIIELFALDKRLSANKPITGDALEKEIKNHTLAKTVVQE